MITYNESTVTYSSSLYRYNGESVAQQFDRSISDALGLSDSLVYNFEKCIFLQDTVGLTDSIKAVQVF